MGTSTRPGLLSAAIAWGVTFLVAVVAMVIIGWDDSWTTVGPSSSPADGLTIFAVFFVAAAALERLIEPFAKALGTTGDEATRPVWLWAVASSLGILGAAALDLNLLSQVGVASPRRILDVVATGLIIGAGTKPLHDLTKLIEKKKETAEVVAAGASSAVVALSQTEPTSDPARDGS